MVSHEEAAIYLAQRQGPCHRPSVTFIVTLRVGVQFVQVFRASTAVIISNHVMYFDNLDCKTRQRGEPRGQNRYLLAHQDYFMKNPRLNTSQVDFSFLLNKRDLNDIFYNT